MMVQGVDGEEYLERLSTSTDTYYHSESQGTLQ